MLCYDVWMCKRIKEKWNVGLFLTKLPDGFGKLLIWCMSFIDYFTVHFGATPGMMTYVKEQLGHFSNNLQVDIRVINILVLVNYSFTVLNIQRFSSFESSQQICVEAVSPSTLSFYTFSLSLSQWDMLCLSLLTSFHNDIQGWECKRWEKNNVNTWRKVGRK